MTRRMTTYYALRDPDGRTWGYYHERVWAVRYLRPGWVVVTR